MLATQLNHLIASDPPAIEKNSIIKLVTYACNVVQNRRYATPSRFCQTAFSH
jgi:hypothetical protein